MKSQALLKAVSAGRPRQVRLLLDSGSFVDATDDCRQTALIRAVFLDQNKNREKIIKTLLKKGALVSKADVVGRDALSWAALYGRDSVVAMLLEYADVDLDLNKMDVNGQTPLFHAVSSGSAATVKLVVQELKKYDMSVDLPDFSGNSPLMQAVRLGHDVCASILIQHGKAKVGLGMKYPDHFTTAEKWAIQNLRSRERVSNNRKSKFPSIMTTNTRDKYKTQECGMTRVSIPLYSESEGESSEDESDLISVTSSNGDIFADKTVRPIMKRPSFGIPTSILAVSPSSSTAVNASSDEEVDISSTPVVEDKSKFKETLRKIYGLKQAQMSTSYRPTVFPPPVLPTLPPTASPPAKQLTSISLLSDRSDLSNRSMRRARKGSDKWNISKVYLKIKRQGTEDSIMEVTPRPSLSESVSFVSEKATDDVSSPRHNKRGPAFPILTNKKTNLVQSVTMAKNYSNM